MNSILLTRIENNSDRFSKGQRAIARYIGEHYDKAAFMTAARLGTTVGVSESTVVRFATELGYDGYPELQKAMQEMIRSRLTSVQRMEVANDRIGNADILKSVLQADIETIRNTLDTISREEFAHAVDAIVQTKHIYIVATRSCAPVSAFLGYYFNLLLGHVTVVNAVSESEFFEKLLRVNTDDTVIGFSFPRYSTSVAKALHFAHDKGATIISVTDSPDSPIAQHATHLLLTRNDMVSVVDSLVAPLSLINALIAAVAARKKDEVSSVFAQLENIWDKYAVYEKAEEEE